MFYQAKVLVWDNLEDNEQIETTIVIGSTWEEVIKHLTDFYGEDDLLEILSIVRITDLHVIEVTDAIIDYIKKNNDY